MIDFRTHPDQYKHWALSFDGPVATLTMDIDENGGLFEGYQLKLNSYDLGVDIELADAVQRLRFEHPEVRAVILRSAKDRVFCAGANIRMLGGATHVHKVNFCKFTNETRNGIEDASNHSGQVYLCEVNGTAAGGGYELALATEYIVMADDGASAVSLPEVPLLAVLPGTGGLTRVTDKRKVRRDLADVFCTIEEGVRGQRAVDWRLVDEVVPASQLRETTEARARAFADRSDRPEGARGVTLTRIEREITPDRVAYRHVTIDLDRTRGVATLTVHAPAEASPRDVAAIEAQGADYWTLAAARELDDAILHLRLNETETGTLLLKTAGDRDVVASYDEALRANAGHWLVREMTLYWKRVLKRLDVTSRSLFTVVEPGSCFVGLLAELLFAADRSYMLDGQFEGDDTPAAAIRLTESNFGPFPMSNDITRLQTRFLGEPESVEVARQRVGSDLTARDALDLGLVTFAPDDIDWDDEIRLALEERASFSPDGLIGLEANLRFAGPETMETRIFGRLTAWQNWIFQRPNAVSETGALKRYGTGERAQFDKVRV
ncbi:2,3-epoxybenzoyl-CoA dihydrolase [Caenispirillum bisanense]|uniref:2,3-dihydro-2,3-dihydroxybenzoyl-CoA ring cleavage enzyme n=1 Tax=Caenispirillum bisanense TaxID=414052 RepID=A0A286GL44_9PROT|nr:2,3-epoxybenzoyl-CoA dihydrolase [Caenispirillum bisanense]SOD96267.1 2,3-dihydro-2,3-dihydroxybenzoyl-CoA ring cleavage enzyme [Caenispirillum bisanense]